MENVITMYGGKDPRDLPFYGISNAAFYLGIHESTLRAWAGGKPYVVNGVRKNRKPLFTLADADHGLLSFNNFVEAYVLASLTRRFEIPMQRVRVAVEYLGGEHPLLTPNLLSDKVGIYVERLGSLVDVARGGQTAIREVVQGSLERIDFDADQRPTRLYPWRREITEEKLIVIDPRLAFGRPTVAGRGIKVGVVIDRHRAGESVDDLSRDYDIPKETVEGVLRWGLDAAKAA